MGAAPGRSIHPCEAAGAVALALWAAFGAVLVFAAGYVYDEGFYCLISREVHSGRALYSDIRFTQMPLLPHLYGALLAWLPPRIESGRLLSLVFALVGLVFLWRTLARLFGPLEALAGLAMPLVSFAFAGHIVRVTTAALAFCLSSAALYATARVATAPTQEAGSARAVRVAGAFAAGLLLGAAVLARLSLLPLAVLAIGFLLLERRRAGLSACRQWDAAAPAAGTMLAAAVALACLARDADRFLFGIYRYNTLLGARLDRWETFHEMCLGVFQNGVAGILALAAAAVLAVLRRRGERPAQSFATRFTVFALVAWAAITLIHVTRRPAYPIYQIPLFWGPAIAASWLAHRLEGLRRKKVLIGAVLATCLATLPLQESAWAAGTNAVPAAVAEAAAPLRAAHGGTLVTLDAGIAFCAPDMRLLQGYEMGLFSVGPEGITQEEMLHYRGTHRAKFEADVARADFAAITLNTTPRLVLSLADSHEEVAAVEGYGQFGASGDIMLVLRRRAASKESGKALVPPR